MLANPNRRNLHKFVQIYIKHFIYYTLHKNNRTIIVLQKYNSLQRKKKRIHLTQIIQLQEVPSQFFIRALKLFKVSADFIFGGKEFHILEAKFQSSLFQI